MSNILFTMVGLAMLLVGGDIVVRGTMWFSQRLRLSPFFIGMIVVGFGTSLPELIVCIDAALNGSPGLAVGNVIGSNIANTLLILGVTAAICPVVVEKNNTIRDSVSILLTTAFFIGIGIIVGHIQWFHGVVMVVGLCGYIIIAARGGRAAFQPDITEIQPQTGMPLKYFALVIFGFILLIFGAEFLVTGAVGLSTQLGFPEEVIGLTVIAIGTSLPEIATTSAAAWRGKTQLCLGNVLGSNLFNISGLAGITALITPLPFSQRIVQFDLLVLVAVTLFISSIMIFGKQISRPVGYTLTITYFTYLTAQLAFVG